MTLTLNRNFNIRSANNISGIQRSENMSGMSFAQGIEQNRDSLSFKRGFHQEEIEVIIKNADRVQLLGTLNNKKYDMKLNRKRNSESNIDIIGEYNSKKAGINAKYKSINSYFKGRLGSDDFNLTFHEPVFFGDYSIKGKINGEKIKLKFPGAEVDERYKDVVLLILSLNGASSEIEDGKYNALDYSDTCMEYYDCETEEVAEGSEIEEEDDDFFEEERSLLDTIWKKPIFDEEDDIIK